MGLRRYQARRDFARTSEPAGRVHQKRTHKEPVFVVQKHAATRLHYDFRLEIGGVLKSWAVPKGFPVKRGDRRLAVQVEDHPVEYGEFEGVIPEGNYGAGTVLLWDTGAFKLLGGSPEGALREGKLHLLLRGKKLKGEWTLVRMRLRPGEDPDKPNWLLLKSGSDLPPFGKEAENRSVVSRRTMEEIAARKERAWQSNRAAKNPTSKAAVAGRTTSKVPREMKLDPDLEAKVEAAPAGRVGFLAPMKAAPVTKLPTGPQWIYEIKFDGIRALALKAKDRVQLMSRNENEVTPRFAELAAAVRQLKEESLVLDGEIVAVDEKGRPSFQLLQRYHQSKAPPPLLFYLFDILHLRGRSLLRLPLSERKAILQSLLGGSRPPLLFSGPIGAESHRVQREMQARGLEGLIAKKKDSCYEPGGRSGSWVKFKWTVEQEFVIGGFTPPQGTRSFFGALIIGYYEKGKLQFAGKVGTGFDYQTLQDLHGRLSRLKIGSPPFADIRAKRGREAYGLTAAQIRDSTWVRPELVCQVRFTEWTDEGQLRHPAYLGLREDKDPVEVVREPVAEG